MEFKLPYFVRNCGDGSVVVEFCPNKETAEKGDEELDEGWGESSASCVKLKVKDGRLYYQDFQEIGGKYEYVWVEVKV